MSERSVRRRADRGKEAAPDMRGVAAILSDYLFDPERFWPEDSYFHRRNRTKIGKARAGLGIKRRADVEAELLPGLAARAAAGARTLFVVSNGASGCHFFGSVLASSPRYRLIGEVYFPPELAALAADIGDPAAAHVLMDAVSALAMGDRAALAPDTVPVNVMHLRPDTPEAAIRAHLPGARMVALIRNPYDIALSRTFRKAEYRQASNPEAGDADYARIQAGGVRRFHEMAAGIGWDAVVRYENLVREPLQVATDTLWTLGFPADGLRQARPEIDNRNPAPRPGIPAEVARIFFDTLAATAARLHYAPPADMRFGDLADARHWMPMQTELLTPAVKKRARNTGQVHVVANLDPFDADTGLDAIGVEARTETWQMYFWTFCWLHLLPETGGGGGGGEALLLRRLGEVLDLTLAHCLDPEAAPARFWDDHATAYRSGTLLYLVHRHYDHEVVRTRLPALGTVFGKHAEMLEGFIADDRWAGNNHGVFHAMALINLCVNCEHVAAAGRLETGRRHLQQTLAAIIDPVTGMSREQCFHYHLWSTRLLEDVEDFLGRTRMDIGIDVHELIEKMLAFGAFLMVGDEALPAIGDTGYRSGYKRVFVERKIARVFGGRFRDVCDLGIGSAGNGFTTVMGVDDEFCAIRGPGPGGGAAPDPDGPAGAGDNLMVATAWHARVSHGHFDVLSVWFTRGGQPLLIDSGGPYNYGSGPRFSYFIQPQAHNVVMVDRTPYRGGGRILGRIGTADMQGVLAEIADNHGVRHRRACAMTAAGELLIVDRLHGLDGQDHLYSALYHLPPGAAVGWQDGDGCRVAEIAGDGAPPVRMVLAGDGAGAPAVAVHAGDEDDLFQGWVTASQSHMQPAPVLVVEDRARDRLLVTLVEGGRPVRAARLRSGNGQLLRINYRDGGSAEIALDALLAPAGAGAETDLDTDAGHGGEGGS